MLGLSLAIEATRSRSPADSERDLPRTDLRKLRSSGLRARALPSAPPDRLRVATAFGGFKALRISAADFSAADAAPMLTDRAKTAAEAAKPTLNFAVVPDI